MKSPKPTVNIRARYCSGRRNAFVGFIAAALTAAASVGAATLIDLGTTAPTPGTSDVSQLSVESGNTPPGLNYYFDNSTPPGQTFTTGANANGYTLKTVSMLTDGNSGSIPSAGQTYTLRFYSVSGSTATLVNTFTSQSGFVFADYDWLQWTNLDILLSANTKYAYTLQRGSAGWERMGTASGDLYTGGAAVLIPTAGGPISSSTTSGYDAAFCVGLEAITSLTVSAPVISPSTVVPVGTAATLSTTVAGGSSYSYQWRGDGGSGGTLTNLPLATSATLTVNTNSAMLGVYRYCVVVSSGSLSTTSAVASLTVYTQSGATLADVGASITSGLYDISQLTGGGSGDGLNYYDDNNPPPGQTFTTGANSQGYYLTSLSVQTGGGGSANTETAHSYYLYVYSIANGTNATLYANYTNASFVYTYGDWLTWSGFTPLVLKPNTVYAYAFHQSTSVSGWAGMVSTPGTTDLYPNGQLCLVPTTGGTVTFGSTGMSDAAFDLGLSPIGVGPSPYPFAYGITFSPARTVVAGTTVTLSEPATGTAPLSYQWRTDGGSGGALTNIPSSTTSNLVFSTTGWTPGAYRYAVVVTNSYGAATSAVATLTVTYADATAVLTDIGATDPAPLLAEDLSQLASGNGTPDGLNYYFDNASPPGQTFTTGSASAGYTLTSLAVRSAPNGGTGGLPSGGQAYVLRIYTVSDTNAVLYATYTSQTNFTFVHSDWLRWSGLSLPLASGKTYAYSFGRLSSGSGWENMSSSSGNPYSSGELVLIPAAGGTMTFGSSHDYDATFVAGLAPRGYPYVSPAIVSLTNGAYAGTAMTVQASVTGAGPFTYQWQTDGGNTGTLTNIPDATNLVLAVNTSDLGGATVAYRLVAANAAGVTTGEAASVTLNSVSGPFLTSDISPTSATRFAGSKSLTFQAAFDGTQPIAYQWTVDKGTGATNLIGHTNRTLVLSNLTVGDSGSYSLVATNAVGTGGSSSATLTVCPVLAVSSTVNFQWHSTEGGDAGAYSSTGVTGFGSGTYWNQVTGPASWTPGTYSTTTGYQDDGATETGISWSLTTAGSWSQTGDTTVPLLDSYAMAYGTQSFTFTLPNGRYDLALFGCNGAEIASGNSATVFVVNGRGKVVVPTQDTSLVEGNTYAVFTNVVATGQTLSGTWGVTNGLSFGSLNGAQLKYLGPISAAPASLTAKVSGASLNLSWPADHLGWVLQAQTNTASVGLSTNWADVAGSGYATQASLPVTATDGAVFYRLVYRP
jgi:hypothetical protein